MNLITEAITILKGVTKLAKVCGVSHQVVRRWEEKKLPRTEWTAETHYAAAIEKATNGKVKASDLCPGAGQYMQFERIEKIDFSISKDVNNKTLITIKNFPGLDC
ncbi:helix-turn-helix domain-containing protein, partial [bacterium AH-315-G11]|nr:helix-turn-helix domain-containing protein [bacterium AH-315-G11]